MTEHILLLQVLPVLFAGCQLYAATRLGFGFPEWAFRRHAYVVAAFGWLAALPFFNVAGEGVGRWALLVMALAFIVFNAIRWGRKAER